MYMYAHTHVIFKCIWEIQVLVTPWQAGPPAQCFSGLRTLTSCTCSLSDASALPASTSSGSIKRRNGLAQFPPRNVSSASSRCIPVPAESWASQWVPCREAERKKET